MENYQREFIEFAYQHQVLRFGEFTLKSGRVSPYFFNSGLFNNGTLLSELGGYYAKAIESSGIDYDMLFGPSYKGIPLVSTTAIALSTLFQKDTPYSFNRKEAKTHAEGGVIVGAPLKGKIILVDDVISAGTTFREVLPLLNTDESELVAVAISVDRQETGTGNRSAVQEIEQDYNVPVINIISLENIIEYLKEKDEMTNHLHQILNYQEQYGATI